MKEFIFDIQTFANMNVQTTLLDTKANPETQTKGNDLSPTMKEYYDTELLENAKEELYFNQFGKVQRLPEGNGKSVEWRKFDTFGKALKPLTEGVTPDGNTLNMTSKSAKIEQYGDYTTVSDLLDLVAVDDVILACTEEHGTQAGATLDTLTRNELCKGTNVSFPVGVSLEDDITSAHKLTPTDINKAVTKLKKAKTPKINGKYIAIIHPSVAEDIRESEGWIEAHKYASVTEIFNGEIGELHGVRFIESNEAPVFGKNVKDVRIYGTFIFGRDAYGRVELSGGAMEMIVKAKGSAGTADPLNQRSTVGWKAAHAATILYPERLILIKSASSYDDPSNFEDPSN